MKALTVSAWVGLAVPAAVQCSTADLTAPDPATGDRFGTAVALEAGTLLCSVPRDDTSGSPTSNQGTVRVFAWLPTGWAQTQVIAASDGSPGDRLGESLALAGGTAFVGARRVDGAVTDSGAVYVFERVGGTFVEVQKLEPTGPSVKPVFSDSLAAEGTRLVVGASGDDDTVFDGGAVYHYERTGGVWTLVEKIPSPGTVGAQFGHAVALSGDRLAVGAPYDDTDGQNAGAAWIYDWADGAWQLAARLPGTADAGDFFGYSVFVDGGVALVDTIVGPNQTFLEQAGTWVVGPPGPDLDFGAKEASYVRAVPPPGGLGLRVLTQKGVYLFDGAAWSPDASFDTGTEPVSALASDGSTHVIGTFEQDVGSKTNAGVVHVFTDQRPETFCTGKVNSQGCLPAIASTGTPSATSALPFTVSAADVLNQSAGLLFYGSGRAALPFQGGTLCVAPPLGRTPPLFSGGNPFPPDCSGTYSFDFNALIQGGTVPYLVPGQTLDLQWYQRDPFDPVQAGLTDALELVVCG